MLCISKIHIFCNKFSYDDAHWIKNIYLSETSLNVSMPGFSWYVRSNVHSDSSRAQDKTVEYRREVHTLAKTLISIYSPHHQATSQACLVSQIVSGDESEFLWAMKIHLSGWISASNRFKLISDEFLLVWSMKLHHCILQTNCVESLALYILRMWEFLTDVTNLGSKLDTGQKRLEVYRNILI